MALTQTQQKAKEHPKHKGKGETSSTPIKPHITEGGPQRPHVTCTATKQIKEISLYLCHDTHALFIY